MYASKHVSFFILLCKNRVSVFDSFIDIRDMQSGPVFGPCTRYVKWHVESRGFSACFVSLVGQYMQLWLICACASDHELCTRCTLADDHLIWINRLPSPVCGLSWSAGEVNSAVIRQAVFSAVVFLSSNFNCSLCMLTICYSRLAVNCSGVGEEKGSGRGFWPHTLCGSVA